MKKLTIMTLLLFVSRVVYSQSDLPNVPLKGKANTSTEEVIKLDPRMSAFDFVPGQILAKFKDDTPVRLGKTSTGKVVVGIESVDQVLSKYQLRKAERLFPNEQRILNKRLFKTYNGNEIEESSLHNIYKFEFDSTTNVMGIIEELKQNTNVIYAEPNYILSIVDSKPVSPELTEKEMLEWLKNNHSIMQLNNKTETVSSLPTETVPNDPLYSQQWYINEVEADSVWKQTTGDTTQVIAILDTGVDWLHPDLKNKIWINKDEIPDNGIDDDHDGYVDDIRGWDWINNDNNPTDDNSHGTHVAGIAAAETNNGIGIAGVNWKAKIMALKVFQSSGRGDAATITQGINYAATHGATVINMSFGSYTRSLTMEAALANAYSTCVLVAAAGNDGLGIGPPTVLRPLDKPFFPAALSYVLGTEVPVDFSNFDQDGPVFSKYSDLWNYELKAPGTNIISTIPNGGYRIYQGTSMAAPIISGGVALYREVHPADSQELMWGNLINSISGNVKLNAAINSNPQPKLWFVSNSIVDTLDGDKDGQVDAGETIDLWFMLRNTWGTANKVKIKLRFGEFEDHSVATILRDTVTIGSMSSYAKRSNETKPFRVKINPSIANNRDIVFQALSWNDGIPDTTYQKITLTAFNGTELSGVMDSTLVLTPNRLWLVNNSFRVGSNGRLILKPGVVLNLNSSVDNKGVIEAIGKKDSLIQIKGPATITGNGVFNFKYVRMSDINGSIGSLGAGNFKLENGIVENIDARNTGFGSGFGMFLNSNISIKNSIIRNCYFRAIYSYSVQLEFIKNIFHNNFINNPFGVTLQDGSYQIKYNVFNKMIDYFKQYGSVSKLIYDINDRFSGIGYNSFLNFDNSVFVIKPQTNGDIINFTSQYWGTSNTKKIKGMIYDFFKNSSLPMINYSPILSSPSDSSHGIVWKVLVNGKDAQDEVVDPLGVATHRFDVYFNRAMDKNYPPQITFGVREPYTQQSVALNGSWSADGKIYTAYKKVELYTGDGINRVRVTGARDLEDFEIPVEDMRFEFLIDAAGSASTDFLATAGIGKVNLEWPAPSELPTLLGYNIYRFTNLTDTTFTDPVQINDQLVTDTTYIDYKVEPHKKYYYKYKVVRTDFTESDYSKVVNATVLTAAKGDANGDLTITVQDIVSLVAYILNQNPQPFLAEAADVNSDGKVDILDIVGIINKIMNPGPGKIIAAKPKVRFDKEGVYVENGEGVAGIEIKIVGEGIEKAQVISGEMAKGMELAYKMNKDTLTVLMFSFKNETMQGNGGLLLKLSEGKIKKLYNMKASDMRGNEVEIEYSKDDLVIPSGFVLYQNYPNPFNPTTTIKYGLPEKRNVEVIIYNILGQKIKMWSLSDQSAGYHELLWNSTNDNNQIVSSGVYIYQIRAGNYINQKKMLLIK